MNGVTREDFEATLKEAMLSIEDSEGEGTWKEEENVITLTYGEKEHVLYSVRPASSHQYFLENMNGIKLYGINK